MLVRILIMSMGCWWSAISAAECPANQPDGLIFEDGGNEGWCYTFKNEKKCVKELKGFKLVPVAPPDHDYYYYCGSSLIMQRTMQGQYPTQTGQVPPPTTTQGGGVVQQGVHSIDGGTSTGTTGEGAYQVPSP